MLRIAYCQISAHPAYCGTTGAYIKEPIFDEKGPILNQLSEIQIIYDLTKQIESLYLSAFHQKLQQFLHALEKRDIDLLVFPEYSIPATELPLLYDFCQKEHCICIAASHTVQKAFEETYHAIHMNIIVDKCLNMSCCPVIIPGKETQCFFKNYKSKWESNMETETYPDCGMSGKFTIEVKNTRVTVLLCIDALHVDVDKSNTDILIVPAASPSDGLFNNKFESYLSKDIPTIFCNFCSYGNSTVYCQVPENRNIAYGEKTHITKAAKNEEFVAIVELDKQCQQAKVHTINTDIPIQVVEVDPILYRDQNAKQHDWLRIKELCAQKNYAEIESAVNLHEELENGILHQKKKYLLTGIREQTLSYEDILLETEFIYINDYTLTQYETNWLEKIIKNLTAGITENKLNINKVVEPFSRLSSALQKILPTITEKSDIPVFGSAEQVNSTFQNRGGEIQRFRDVQQNQNKTIFVVQGLSQVGKSAFINRVSSLYSFRLLNFPIPKGGSLESLIRGVCELTGTHMDWDEINEETVNNYAGQFAQYLCNLNKSIVVFRTTANLFNSYDLGKSVLFFRCVAEHLYMSKAAIKLILESPRVLPVGILEHPNIEVCKLKPINDVYIGRLIEQTSNNITYSLSLPQIDSKTIRQCCGNPAVARMVGICIGHKINRGENSEISQSEVDAFKFQYVQKIFKNLNITPEEQDLLTEASIYRLDVPKKAYMSLPHYSDQTFDRLKDNLLLEANSDWHFVNTMLSGTLRKIATKDKNLHKIAAAYFDEEYKENPTNVAKAEYIYHASFSGSHLSVQENLKYYANDILAAAIELINNGEIDTAYTHLKQIQYYSHFCNQVEFNFYYALCHIVDSEFDEYRKLFDQAVAESKRPMTIYFRMIARLIGLRILNEAENLLNEAEDTYPSSRQLKALWISLQYATKQTRNQAIVSAQELTKCSTGDFYSSKILVRIYCNENMKEEALKEITDVLNEWPNNKWAQKVRRDIFAGIHGDQDNELFEADDED